MLGGSCLRLKRLINVFLTYQYKIKFILDYIDLWLFDAKINKDGKIYWHSSWFNRKVY